jgi:glucokinase
MIVAGDIGGTHTRLVLHDDGGGPVRREQTFLNGAFPGFEAALGRFLDEAGRPQVTSAAFAVAGTVLGGHVRMTNLGWSFDEQALARALGGARVRLLNDLEAAAYGVPLLPAEELRTIAMGRPSTRGNFAVIAAGTGLGEAIVTWHGETPIGIASEGGHADFAPRDETDVALFQWLAAQRSHVSWEAVVAGPSIVKIYEFLRDTGREQEPAALRDELAAAPQPSVVITRAGIADVHPICVHVLDVFVRAYGAEAGNLALKCLALGGIYIAGGIAPHLLEGRWSDRFMEAFVDKGRYTELLRTIPVRIVLSERASLVGAAAVASR